MKLYFRFFVIIAAIAVSLISCQKEFTLEEGPDPVDPPPTIVDSNFLSKIYYIDSTGTVSDTTSFVSVFYDTSKRVVKIVDSSIGTTGGVRSHNEEIFYYNGSDTLPFKSIFYNFEEAISSGDPTQIDTFTRYFLYNAQAQLILDSGISRRAHGLGIPLDKEIYRHKYNADKIYTQFFYRDENDAVLNYKEDTSVVNSSGNLVSTKGYEFSTGVSVQYLTGTYSYDDKINPFSKLSIFKTFQVAPYGETYSGDIQSKNNLLISNEVSTNLGTQVTDYTGKYRYNVKGYPIALVTEDITTTGFYYKLAYVYIAL